MGMGERKRLWFVFLSLLAVVAIAILSGGLSSVELGPGRSLPRLPSEEGEEDGLDVAPATRVVTLALRVLLIVAGALLPFIIILYVISPEARKRALGDLIVMLSILLPLYFLLRGQPETLEAVDDIVAPPAASGNLPPAPDVSFTPGPRQWLVLVLTVGIALLLAAVLVGLAWMVWRRRQRPSESLDRLAEQAQSAIDALEAGADLKDTVMRCYFEMMQVLKEERGIRRQRAMTPREFEVALERTGIPTTQVRRLTRLFEQVRYGDKRLGEQEERQAIISLTAVVRFCRSA